MTHTMMLDSSINAKNILAHLLDNDTELRMTMAMTSSDVFDLTNDQVETILFDEELINEDAIDRAKEVLMVPRCEYFKGILENEFKASIITNTTGVPKELDFVDIGTPVVDAVMNIPLILKNGPLEINWDDGSDKLEVVCSLGNFELFISKEDLT